MVSSGGSCPVTMNSPMTCIRQSFMVLVATCPASSLMTSAEFENISDAVTAL